MGWVITRASLILAILLIVKSIAEQSMIYTLCSAGAIFAFSMAIKYHKRLD